MVAALVILAIVLLGRVAYKMEMNFFTFVLGFGAMGAGLWVLFTVLASMV